MRIVRVTVGILAASTLVFAQPPRGTWRKEPDLLTPRAAHAVVATADAIYAVAGTGPEGRRSSIWSSSTERRGPAKLHFPVRA
jgi:hypothetical protein